MNIGSTDAPAPEGHKPTEYIPGARAVVSGGIEVLDEILKTTPSSMYCKHYDQLNEWLNEAGYELCRFLRRHGFKAMWFPESDDYNYYNEQRFAGMRAYCPSFSHISAAVAAGLGKRGKVGVALTPQYGPRQRWMSVITTAPLIPSAKLEQEVCLERIQPGSCGDKCIEVCKTKQSGALRPWPEEGGVNMFRSQRVASHRPGESIISLTCLSKSVNMCLEDRIPSGLFLLFSGLLVSYYCPAQSIEHSNCINLYQRIFIQQALNDNAGRGGKILAEIFAAYLCSCLIIFGGGDIISSP